MVMWRVGEDDTKGRARPLPTVAPRCVQVQETSRNISCVESRCVQVQGTLSSPPHPTPPQMLKFRANPPGRPNMLKLYFPHNNHQQPVNQKVNESKLASESVAPMRRPPRLLFFPTHCQNPQLLFPLLVGILWNLLILTVNIEPTLDSSVKIGQMISFQLW